MKVHHTFAPHKKCSVSCDRAIQIVVQFGQFVVWIQLNVSDFYFDRLEEILAKRIQALGNTYWYACRGEWRF